MELWSELFSDWVGILSFLVIAFIIGMAAFFLSFFMGKSHQDPKG
jgi:NADH:ubiquinone oxidoreductase subunit 3 (subunit A)